MKFRNTALKYGLGAAALTLATSAMAELPEGAEAAFTTLQTDGIALQGMALPIMVALAVGSVIIGLVVRYIKRSGRAA